MDELFKPAMDAAYAGDVERFKYLSAETPELILSVSSQSHPSLFQFIVVEGGLGKIPDVEKFVAFMLENDASIKLQLVAAASVNSRTIVDMLLDAKVPIDDGAPWTALEETLYWKHQTMGRYLHLERGFPINSLSAAAMLGKLTVIERYFSEPDRVGHRVFFPWGEIEETTQQDVIDQAMLLCLRNSQYDAASMLLEYGADINAIPPGNHEACTMLHQAVYLKDFEMVDWLIDREAVANIIDPRFKADAIGWAKHFKDDAMTEHLIKRCLPSN